MNISRFLLPVAVAAAVSTIAFSSALADSMRDGDAMSPGGYQLDFSLPEGVNIFADIAVGAYIARDEVSTKINRTSVKSDGQVGFDIERTIFNGLQIIGNATWDLSLDPESYAVGLGGGFGQFRIGSEANIAERLHISVADFVPHSAVSLDSADIYPSSNGSAIRSTFVESETMILALGVDHTLKGNVRDDDSDIDPNALTYISGNVGGFVVGFSYIPDFDDFGQANQGIAVEEGAGNSVVTAATILGGRYEGRPLGPGSLEIAASFGFMDAESNNAGLSPQAASGALHVKAGSNVTIGATYFESRDLANVDSDQHKVWIASIAYRSGDITVGAAYRKSRSEYQYDGTAIGDVGGNNVTFTYDDVNFRGHNETLQIGMKFHTRSRFSYGFEARHIRDRNNLAVANTTVTTGSTTKWKKSYAGAFVLSISY